MADTSRSDGISTKLQRVAELARQLPRMVLTTLAHHMDLEFLREAYRRTRKSGAVGVDGQTAEAYARNLDSHLQLLLGQAKSGAYKAPPVRRVYIPKGDGSKTRPIGIPAFEDKVLQRAVVMLLETVYEEEFLDCSYGFRPGRSPHQALESLWHVLMRKGGGYVLEADIRSFFDTLDHGHLRRILDQRVRDGVLRRLIDKWLKAGVLEEGCVWHPETGTPQGGVISPLLANIYLHEVLDRWFEEQVRPHTRGTATLVRFADDFVIVFEVEAEARRFMEVLPERFARYGLALHPEKTRLVSFKSPRRGKASTKPPGTFDFLGFTHFWGVSRKGRPVVKRKTAGNRFTRALRSVRAWARMSRHLLLRTQHEQLKAKLRGHYGYYGITGNWVALANFRHEVRRVWKKWLGRRSQRRLRWEAFVQLEARYPLPPAIAVHSLYRRAASP